MQFDITVFSWLNGWAGRWMWLDEVGRYLAVYGLLAVLLLTATMAWWGRAVGVRRGAYLRALGIAAACCALLFALDWLVTTQVLHHPLRARPANAIWTTPLITEESAFGFPAWPALIAAALALPTYLLFRRAGLVALVVTGLLGVSLVFVGVNYPLDVLTGLFIGVAIGMVAASVSGVTLPRERAPWRRPTVVASALVLWCGVLGVSLTPASTVGDTVVVDDAGAGLRVTPPLQVLNALHAAVDVPISVEAASNGHLLVAAVTITVAHDATLPAVREAARRAVNAGFAHWDALELVTLTVVARFPRETGGKLGTLYTATVSRDAWPPGGFAAHQALPGKKYYHPRFYPRQDTGNSPSSTGNLL